MGDSILVALITGGLALIGNVLAILASSKKTETTMQVNQAVITQKVDDIAKDVEKIDSVVEKTHELEKTVATHEEKISVANHRISDLEEAIKKGVA